jgi:hypothetical protein
MPNRAIQRAKQRRGAALGQSSRLYMLNGELRPGAGGFGKTNPSVGSMKVLNQIKLVRIARKSYLQTTFSRASGNNITGGGSFRSKHSSALLSFY